MSRHWSRATNRPIVVVISVAPHRPTSVIARAVEYACERASEWDSVREGETETHLRAATRSCDLRRPCTAGGLSGGRDVTVIFTRDARPSRGPRAAAPSSPSTSSPSLCSRCLAGTREECRGFRSPGSPSPAKSRRPEARKCLVESGGRGTNVRARQCVGSRRLPRI